MSSESHSGHDSFYPLFLAAAASSWSRPTPLTLRPAESCARLDALPPALSLRAIGDAAGGWRCRSCPLLSARVRAVLDTPSGHLFPPPGVANGTHLSCECHS